MTAAAAAIETSQLTKAFGVDRAVDGLDLSVPVGGVYGLLGPNGAGKTTAIRILATLLKPDAGSARVLGHDVVEEATAVRSRVVLTGQFASLDEELTGRENLVLMARLLGHDRRGAKDRADQLLEAFGLTDSGDRLVKGYSGGMRRRLDIAASIVVSPELLFLDEPTTGLDPHSRAQVWSIIDALVDRGSTILLTTQYLDEADRLADRVAVIDHGRVVAEGTPGALKASVGGGAISLRVGDAAHRDHAATLLERALGTSVVVDTDAFGLRARLPGASDGEAGVQAVTVLQLLSRNGVAVTELAIGQPSLDEVFITLTGHRSGPVPATAGPATAAAASSAPATGGATPRSEQEART